MQLDPRRQARAGVATVEFALTCPILILLVFGAIEFTRANQLLHTAGIAATEGARAGIIPGATAAEVEQVARTELNVIGIASADIIVVPSTIDRNTQVVTVGVNVPMTAANGYLTPRFFLGRNVSKVVSMTREAKKSDKNAGLARAQEAQAKTGMNNGNGQGAGNANNANSQNGNGGNSGNGGPGNNNAGS